MKTSLLAAATTAATLFATSSSAAIVANIGDGQSFCESQNLSVWSGTDCDLGGNADLSNSLGSSDALTFLGAGSLLGFVADASGTNNTNYPDYATITLSQNSIVTMSLVAPDNGFDAAFQFGNAFAGPVTLDGSSLSYSFVAAAGSYFFGIDATNPTNSNSRVTTSYALEVQAVPLPAGFALMLTGMGGFAAMRRKKKA